MTFSWPYSHIFLRHDRTILISGPYIHKLDTSNGALLLSVELGKASTPIRCASLSTSGGLLVTSADDKLLRVWDVETLSILSARPLPKKPTKLLFTFKDDTILVSDKFGDIFSYPTTPVPSNVKSDEIIPTAASNSHNNPSDGTLVLGHTSVLTDFSLTNDERFIISADRDEHIRISRYPKGWVIENYCLGSQKFVSGLHLPSFAPQNLVSGGGDATLKIWDWLNGNLVREIKVRRTIEPFIKIRPKKRRNAEPSDMDDKSDALFAIAQISSFTADNVHYLMFTAIGATALFWCPYGDDDSGGVLSYNCREPITQFSIFDGDTVIVLVDSPDPESRVRIFKISSTETVILSPSSCHLKLVETIAAACVHPATAGDIQNLDLYALLISLPKNSADLDVGDEDEDAELPTKMKVKSQTKREKGRLRNQAKVQGVLKSTVDGDSV